MQLIGFKEDDITPIDLLLKTYNKACEPKEIELFSGSHFDPFDESSGKLESVAAVQLRFLSKWLL